MIEFKVVNTYLQFSFTFFVTTAFFLITNSGFGMAALCACGIHELSHLVLMIIFGIPADEILFYGAGIRISSREISRAGKLPRALILIAGCAGNIIAAAVMLIAGNNVASAINLFTSFFNILPIGSLDGAQLLKNFAVSRYKPENVDKVMRIAGIGSAVLLLAIVILIGGASFYFSIIILYIVFLCCLKT
ncbi:MAG: hypothetical protein J1F04_00405 [Oscillospiraceae bacterium]|nr:hypothetical protein [Oscillospiraceae bacterium]